MVRERLRSLVVVSGALVGAGLLAVWWLTGTVIPLQLGEQIHCPELFGPPAACDSSSLLLLLPIAAALAVADFVPHAAAAAALLIGFGAAAVARDHPTGAVLVLLPAGVVGAVTMVTAVLTVLAMRG